MQTDLYIILLTQVETNEIYNYITKTYAL